MTKYIIEYNDRGERNYVCEYDANYQIQQTSKSYSAGVKEFDTEIEAKKVADKLRGYKGKLLSELNKDATIVPVHV